MRGLKARLGGEIEVAGPDLARSLIDLGLIDEYRRYLCPVVVGRGKPFFAGPRPPLRIAASDRIVGDAIRLTYCPTECADAAGPLCPLRSSRRGFAHSLDMVSIWIDDEGRIVMGTVMWSKTWCSIVHTAVRQCSEMECYDRFSTWCSKGQVMPGTTRNRGSSTKLNSELISGPRRSVADSLIGMSECQIFPDS